MQRIALISIATVGVLGILLYGILSSLKTNSVSTTIPPSESSLILDEIQNILETRHKDKITKIERETGDKIPIHWVDSDGHLLNLEDDSKGFSMHVSGAKVSPPYSFFESDLKQIEELFNRNGFDTNDDNRVYAEDYAYQVSYRYENRVCMVNIWDGYWINEKDPTEYNLRISCSDALEKASLEQVPVLTFLKADDKETYIYLHKSASDFYDYGVVGRFGGGHHVFLKKTLTGYIEVFSGQDTVSCEAVDKYEVPRELYFVDGKAECYNYTDGKEELR